MTKRELKLGAFLLHNGHHVAAWRHPQADTGADPLRLYQHLAKTAERACFDAVFFADSVALTSGVGGLEPLTLLSAIAAVTDRIGLIGTATTTYNEPYHVARKFASLDRISRGRAGWNLVTSDNAAEAANFGRTEHVGHAERYERAKEFHQVVQGLWDSWEDDAILNDKQNAIQFDPQKLHTLQHRGKHFSVAGPLNVSRSPQGKPITVQAGGSETGKNLAAETADVVFTAHPTLASAQAFYQDLKARVEKAGRHRDDLKIMPGLFPVVAKTQEEAQQKFQLLQYLVTPKDGIALLGRMIGNFDLTPYSVDEPLPELPLTDNGQQSRQKLLTQLAQGENLTIRELYLRIAGGRGHFTLIGTPEHIADQIQLWFENGAADGFNIMSPYLPGGLEDFTELVVPELQRRGLFRTSYAGTTLREHLGLNFPKNRYAK
ncbi:LLM class flavin-dependent oxidoreductase [Undibacterium sp. FT147W]|uniref:LLM class flavin-dependent oxidoreductase n=1 Tax=Undibacterium rivi TaxID=2828729 RepID=A0ABS5H6Y2_9BURK|nr:LLM class flavin-dependent oxidoreductase [Undibacterium rivi]MBR7793849.1 LLM class flavin-dependent oxidoreductase [Undibacterium rivi]